MNSEPQLVDQYGRFITDLRISVTDRCNFRCTYCMPAEGVRWIDHSTVLSFEEITRIARVLGKMGVRSLRLTGGEPLVRKDLPKLVTMLCALPEIEDLAITTNGYLLNQQAKQLVEAGVQRFNVSIDSLFPTRFAEITRRDALARVLTGLETLAAFQQAISIKVNVVALRGTTEQEVLAFAKFAREHAFQVRFIECMPLDADHTWTQTKVLTGGEILAMIERVYSLEEKPRPQHATARVFRFLDGDGEIGFINPVSEPFCFDCNRIRLTAEGQLRTCLFSLGETDLKTLLRSGCDDQELTEVIRQAVWRKEQKHAIGQTTFRQPERTMSQIGG